MAFTCMLVGCSGPYLEQGKDTLTGQEYCKAHLTNLRALNKSDHASLLLKNFKQEHKSFVNKPVKATLNITHEGKKDYTINPQETLSLLIDDMRYPLEMVSSFKRPDKVVDNYYVSLPSGGFTVVGNVKDVTNRKISFLLPQELIDQLSGAKSAGFEVSLLKYSQHAQNYPIIFYLTQEDIKIVQEFKNNCIKSLKHLSGEKK